MTSRYGFSVAMSLALLVLWGCPPPEEPEARGELPEIDLTEGPAFPLEGHLESERIAGGEMGFEELFEAGGELFHTPYNAYDGVGGLRLPDGTPMNRFASFPPGGGHGAPISSQSCGRCHIDGASGPAQSNVVGDPGDDGTPPFRVRSTTSLLGDGLLQLLGQEMTEELQAIREEAAEAAKEDPGIRVERALAAKGIEFGSIAATANGGSEVTFDLSGLEGVDPDLVVRPLGWKGHVVNIRTINVGAAAGLLGMQSEELVWKLMDQKGVPTADPDGDGIERELSVGDVTAMVVYGAAQETPQPLARLVELGLAAAPSAADLERVEKGRGTFGQIGCADCHLPELRLESTWFEEPTGRGNGHYYNRHLAEKDTGYDPERPVRFDLLASGQEPRVESHPDGGALVRLYGDLKRHAMGRQLADPGGPQPPLTADMDPLEQGGEVVMIPADHFQTAELWGVGNTGPWLHDGRAASLREAILWHGEDEPPAAGEPGRSEAQESREAFVALPTGEQDALLTFLHSLRTFIPPAVEATQPAS